MAVRFAHPHRCPIRTNTQSAAERLRAFERQLAGSPFDRDGRRLAMADGVRHVSDTCLTPKSLVMGGVERESFEQSGSIRRFI